MKSDSSKIGIDGGGTKTECILVDARGKVVARHTAPGCNPSLVGADQAGEILTTALHSLLSGIRSPVSGLLMCMAGSPAFWRDTAAGLKNFGKVTAAPDSLPVLELATAGAPGLVIHSGTGSFVAARAPDESIHYAGGLGWRFGDPGSGMDLGRRGIARALLELQGRNLEAGERRPETGKMSPLAMALCEHAGFSDYSAISRFFYIDPRAQEKIAAFAAQVVELAEHGDDPARQIIAESLNDLAILVNQLLQRFFPACGLLSPASPVSLGVSGPFLNRPPCFQALRALAATHGWPVELRPITEPPIEGVRRLLVKI